MTWNPIIAGVDASPEGVRAATLAARLAEQAGARCQLVHGVTDAWMASPVSEFGTPAYLPQDPQVVLDASRAILVDYLRPKVPAALIETLDTRFGPSAVVVEEAADECDAELVVLGGKHHTAVARWLAGSTVHHLVRRLDRPLLVVGDMPATRGPVFRRVLAAVDLSRAAAPTIDAAERIARACNAQLRVLHALEPLPIVPEVPASLETEVFERAERELEENIWPRVTFPGADHQTRRGPAAPAISNAATDWDADLVVVGTHGRGWVDRMLIGSVTERLLNTLPASLLVVPVSAPARTTATGTKPKRAARVRAAVPSRARR